MVRDRRRSTHTNRRRPGNLLSEKSPEGAAIDARGRDFAQSRALDLGARLLQQHLEHRDGALHRLRRGKCLGRQQVGDHELTHAG